MNVATQYAAMPTPSTSTSALPRSNAFPWRTISPRAITGPLVTGLTY
jgi:hypothetical protein